MTTTYDDAAIFRQPVVFQEAVVMNGGFTPPGESINNTAIAVGAEISADKLKHRHSKEYSQDIGADVVDATKLIHLARAAGIIKSVVVRPMTAPNGGDKQYTVDVRKVANAAAIGASTSLLTTPLVIADADTDNTNKTGALIGVPSYVAGDTIYIVVDATGSTGAQGQGFIVEVNLDESGV